MTLQEKVFQALRNARDNGYDVMSQPPLDQAIDLTMYDADLEDADLDEVMVAVKAYRGEAQT